MKKDLVCQEDFDYKSKPSAFFTPAFESAVSVRPLMNTTGWRVSGKDGAAEILGLNPKTLESRMKRPGIQRNKKNT